MEGGGFGEGAKNKEDKRVKSLGKKKIFFVLTLLTWWIGHNQVCFFFIIFLVLTCNVNAGLYSRCVPTRHFYSLLFFCCIGEVD